MNSVHDEKEHSEPTRIKPLKALGVLTVSCVSGWLIMQMEILAGRVLVPYFGGDVYVVMGSVIGVFLFALSAGYLLGGYTASSKRRGLFLGLALIVAGVWFLALPRFTDPLGEALLATGVDVRIGALIAALVLFGFPAMLLGTVSPTAVRWLTTSASDAGFKAGLVLAVSTVASFAGCVTTAFFLVTLSLRMTIRVSGAILVVVGVCVALLSSLRPKRQRGGAREAQ